MKENYQQKTRVIAIVAPGSANNGRYNFTLGSWELLDNSLSMFFSHEFDIDTDHHTLLEAVEELQKIILALFLTDSIPRRIFCFEYGENIPKPDLFNLWQVFGVPRTHLESEQIINTKSVARIGMSLYGRPLDFVADESVIKPWFEFLLQNPKIASSLQLIQEAYGLARELTTGVRITSFAELSTVILLLVSGLESVFTNPDDTHADISFKFQTVGAAFYSKFVSDKTFENEISFSHRRGKYSYKDFKDILHMLYDLRSSIAHGGFGLNYFNKKKKKMNDLFTKVGVPEVGQDVKSRYFLTLLQALDILEEHILEIFRAAKENLKKGVNILDEIM
jgi:hypothetical protein